MYSNSNSVGQFFLLTIINHATGSSLDAIARSVHAAGMGNGVSQLSPDTESRPGLSAFDQRPGSWCVQSSERINHHYNRQLYFIAFPKYYYQAMFFKVGSNNVNRKNRASNSLFAGPVLFALSKR